MILIVSYKYSVALQNKIKQTQPFLKKRLYVKKEGKHHVTSHHNYYYITYYLLTNIVNIIYLETL